MNQASGLVKMDLRGLCDPYVTVTVTNSDGGGGKTKRTKFIRQNLNPEFNEQFSFPVHSQAQILVVSACTRMARANHLRGAESNRGRSPEGSEWRL